MRTIIIQTDGWGIFTTLFTCSTKMSDDLEKSLQNLVEYNDVTNNCAPYCVVIF